MNITLPAAALLFLLSVPLRAAVLLPDTAGPVLNPPPGAQWDTMQGESVALDGTNAVAGAPNDNGDALGTGKVRVYHAGTGAVLWRLNKPVLPERTALFGRNTAISGNRVVVGMGSLIPAVSVYDLAAANPETPVLTLTSFPGAPASFASIQSLAVSGSLVAVSIGAAGAAGVVLVFDVASGTPAVPLHTLTSPLGTAVNRFGSALALSGSRLVVADREAADGATAGVGRVWAYALGGANPNVALINPSPATGDAFGAGVSVSGGKVLVGAPGHGGGAGEAILYDVGSATPATAILTYPNPTPLSGEAFGSSVAVSAQRSVAGAPGEGAGALSGSGQAYVFNHTAATPAQTLPNPSPAGGDGFGRSVALSGVRVLSGAPLDDTMADDAGAVYSYSLTSGAPTVPVATLNEVSTQVAGVEFGRSLAMSGTRLAVGATNNSRAGDRSGSVTVFHHLSATPATPVLTITGPTQTTAEFGAALAMDGRRLAVAATGETVTFTDAGRVYLYDLTSGTPSVPLTTITNPVPRAGEEFGRRMALSGRWLAIGTGMPGSGQADAPGGVLVYDLDGATPSVPMLTIRSPFEPAIIFSGGQFQYRDTAFGGSLALEGTRLVVHEGGGTVLAPRLLVYDLAAATPTQPVTILEIPAEYATGFIRLSGGLIAVLSRNAASGQGAGHIYDLNSSSPATPRVILSNTAGSGHFGMDAVLSGARLAVVRETTVLSGLGFTSEVHLFDLSSSTPATPLSTIAWPGGAALKFGSALALENTSLAVGDPRDGTAISEQGSVRLYQPAIARPELSALHGTRWIIPGDTLALGNAVPLVPLAHSVDLLNSGTAQLNVTSISFTGTHAADFSISPNSAVNLAAGARRSHTLTVRPGAAGTRTANLRIVSNDPARLTYLIPITVTALSTTTDTDGDGLSDAAEYSLAGLGFNYQISQPALVAAYTAGANTAGYYTQSQLQALNVSMPLIARDPATGNFTLTLDLRRSTNLTTFTDLPLTAGQTSVSGGDVRLSFPLPGNVNFLRVQTGP